MSREDVDRIVREVVGAVLRRRIAPGEEVRRAGEAGWDSLVDEIWLFVFPILLKAGRAAFPALHREMTFKLKASKASKSGVVLMHYVKEKAAPRKRRKR